MSAMSIPPNKVYATFILLIVCLSCVPAYKILGVLHTSSRSHYIVGSALMKELARKGHDVTVISPFPLKEPMKNYHDIYTPSAAKVMDEHIADILNKVKLNAMEKIVNYHKTLLKVTECVLKEDEVQQLMRSNQTFDAVICEVFLSEALFGLSEHFKAPLIGLSSFGAIEWNTQMVGSPSPPSYVPATMLQFTDHMSLAERIGNLAYLSFSALFFNYYYLPQQVTLYQKYFPHLERSLDDVRKNAALVLLNSHVSLSFARPYVPNQVEVGGMHINRKRKPLPENIKKFIEEAEHGVIYFSMGSNLKSKNLPLEKRMEILNTFKGLKQRVLWKFEDTKLEGQPFISDWFPQDDILAHDNVRAFITHGGLLSTTESIYHGKPFIGMPFFGDQFSNMGRAERNGYGIMLDFKKLSTVIFKAAIERIITNPDYTQKVRDMSARYRDQAVEPLDLAVYWVEHVVRHNGAKYLHCAGLDLNFIQYHNIDALLILYGGILLILFLIVWLIRTIWRFLLTALLRKDKKIKTQ